MKRDVPALSRCPACSNYVSLDSPFCPYCGQSLQAHGVTLRQSGHDSQRREGRAPGASIRAADPGTRATIIQTLGPSTCVTIIQPSGQVARLNPIDGAQMISIPAGEFLMGSSDYDDESPSRRIYLEEYWIYRTPVTVEQYQKFCNAAARKMPDRPSWGWNTDHPIVNVSWDDARAYCTWARMDLPTEAQWEKAARGTDGRKFPWGNDWDGSRLFCSKRGFGNAGSTTPVGTFPLGASPYGVLDMAGNVWEWCEDWYEPYYDKGAAHDSIGPPHGARRVLRGGSWCGSEESYFRCANRRRGYTRLRVVDIGFRCAIRPGRS